MIVGVLGPCYIVELFFLHARGRVFTILHLALNFGSSAGPTFSGFIAADTNWPIEYWWTVGLLGATIIFVFVFLEETTFDRSISAVNIDAPKSFFSNRVATFFPGNRVVKRATWGQTV